MCSVWIRDSGDHGGREKAYRKSLGSKEQSEKSVKQGA